MFNIKCNIVKVSENWNEKSKICKGLETIENKNKTLPNTLD